MYYSDNIKGLKRVRKNVLIIKLHLLLRAQLTSNYTGISAGSYVS